MNEIISEQSVGIFFIATFFAVVVSAFFVVAFFIIGDLVNVSMVRGSIARKNQAAFGNCARTKQMMELVRCETLPASSAIKKRE